jgi:hypothetical protein
VRHWLEGRVRAHVFLCMLAYYLEWHMRQALGLIEGINSLVQAAKAKARGYRSIRNLKAMVYLLAGKLDLQLPA